MSTPVKNGRGVLAPLPNGITNTVPSPKIQKKASTGPAIVVQRHADRPPTLPANPSNVRPPLPQTDEQIPASPAILRRPSSLANGNKRGRPSPHLKRVSFGGDTVNIINQHRNEFASPENYSYGSSNSPSPPGKAVKRAWGSSPASPRSPSFHRSTSELLNMDEEQEDTIPLADASNFAVAASSHYAGPSPARRNGTPIPVRRRSVSGRQSFGIFLDDDIERVPLSNLANLPDVDKTLLGIDFNDNAAPSPASQTSDDSAIRKFPGMIEVDEQEEVNLPQQATSHHVSDVNQSPPSLLTRGVSPRTSRVPSPYSARKSSSLMTRAVEPNGGENSNAASKQNRQSLALACRPVVGSNGAIPQNNAWESEILLRNREIFFPGARSTNVASNSNRQSLAYGVRPMAENDGLLPQDNAGESTGFLQRNGEVLQDEHASCDDDDSINDATLNVSRLVEVLEGDEHYMEDIPKPFVNAPTAPSPARPVLPDNRQLFDSTEDTTLHFYPKDLCGGGRIEKLDKVAPATESPQRCDHDDVEERKETSNNEVGKPPLDKPNPDFRRSILKPCSQVQDAWRPSEKEQEKVPEQTHGNPGTSNVSKLATPMSTTGAKVRSLRDPSSENRQHQVPDSGLKPARNAAPMVHQKIPFDMAKFLQVGKLRFDAKTAGLDLRRPSIAQVPDSFASIDRTALHWKLLESLKKDNIWHPIQEQVTKLINSVSATAARINSTTEEIVQERPHVFEKLANSSSLSNKELTTIQMGLKRLQKVTTRQARISWVKSRQIWEKEMLEDLKRCCAVLQQDAAGMTTTEKSLISGRSKFLKELRQLGHDRELNAFRNGSDLDVDDVRRHATQMFSHSADLRKTIATKKQLAKECASKVEELTPKKNELVSLQEKLQTYAEAIHDHKLNRILSERRELNTIVCGATGLKPTTITDNNISVVLADLMDVSLELKDERVVKVLAKPVSLSTFGSEVSQSFASGVVELIKPHIETLEFTNHIPSELYWCSAALHSNWKVFTDAIEYFDGHLGEISGADICTGDYPSLDLTLLASFYSLKLRVKFDVTVVISCFTPEPTKRLPYQEVKKVECCRFIGTTPCEEEVREAIISSGFRRSQDSFNVLDSFAKVWDML